MIDYNQAVNIIQDFLNDLSKSYKQNIVITHVSEQDFGWIFHYNTEAYVKNQNILDCLIGETPAVINKNDGSLFKMPSTILDIVNNLLLNCTFSISLYAI